MVSRKHFQPVPAAANLIASQRPRTDARNGDQRQRPAADGGDVKKDTSPSGLDKAINDTGYEMSFLLAQLDRAPIPIKVSTSVYNRIDDSIPQVASEWEAARQRNADKRGYAQVWVDCELGRVAICRHELPEFRLWNYAHKFAGGEGRILKSELATFCKLLGIATNRTTFKGIIARGNRLYWRERGGYLYLTSWRKLASKLTRWEAKYHPDHVATNRPGQRRVLLDLTGSLKLAHALIYNGWIAVKSERLGYLEISRWTLERLWHRSRRQLLAWEQLAGISTELRYAEHHDITAPLVPNYAYLCLDTDGAEFASWRLPNRFTPAPAILSATNGQRRKVRSACNDIVKSTEPIVLRADGQRRLQRTGKTTFTDRQGKNGIIPAHKQLDKHLRKHHDIFDRRHYAYIATRFGKHIFEMSDGTPVRNGVGRDYTAEQSQAFRQRRTAYRLWWLDRGKAL